MSWWSKVKGGVRFFTKVFVDVVHRSNPGLNGIDTLIGFAAWPRKKLRLHIILLSDQLGTVRDANMNPLTPASLQPAIHYITTVYKKEFNVEVVPYAKGFVEVLEPPAPPKALDVKCGAAGFWADFGEVGDFFATHLAGWNAIPISFQFPITVYVVQNVSDKQGCSNGPATDYIVIDPDGVANPSLMAHEVGHSCGLWHSGTKSNLMYKHFDRGSGSKWFQRNLLRGSRHVHYW